MDAFNQALVADLWRSRFFNLVPGGLYPLHTPQQPGDFRQSGNGLALSDWSAPPVQARYLAFGYTARVRNQLTLYAWLFDVSRPNLSAAQMIGKVYTEEVSEAGARNLAHHFAADIIVKTNEWR